jgi:hypothetical protein
VPPGDCQTKIMSAEVDANLPGRQFGVTESVCQTRTSTVTDLKFKLIMITDSASPSRGTNLNLTVTVGVIGPQAAAAADSESESDSARRQRPARLGRAARAHWQAASLHGAGPATVT